MQIPKQTAITLFDRAKRSLLQDLSDSITKRQEESLSNLQELDSDWSMEAMLEIAKKRLRDRLYQELLIEETEELFR